MNDMPVAERATQSDPLIDEVRAIRASISERFGHDIQKIAENARLVENEFQTKKGRFANFVASKPVADRF